MAVNHTSQSSTARAIEALGALLLRTSAIKFRDVDAKAQALGIGIDILAHIDVLGRGHTLACAIVAGEEPQEVGTALEKLRIGAARLGKTVTPVLVVPCLSPEIRALCKQSNTGFVDLVGNGSLAFGDIFISTRSLPCRTAQQPVKPSARTADGSLERSVREGFAPARAEYPHDAVRIVTHA